MRGWKIATCSRSAITCPVNASTSRIRSISSPKIQCEYNVHREKLGKFRRRLRAPETSHDENQYRFVRIECRQADEANDRAPSPYRREAKRQVHDILPANLNRKCMKRLR